MKTFTEEAKVTGSEYNHFALGLAEIQILNKTEEKFPSMLTYPSSYKAISIKTMKIILFNHDSRTLFLKEF